MDLQQKDEELLWVVKYPLISAFLSITALGSLVGTMALAINTLFFSHNVIQYNTNRELFFNAAFACIPAYFATVYWAMQLRKSLPTRLR